MFRSAKALACLLLVLAVFSIPLTGALADKSSDVLDLVNQQREAAGLKDLKLSEDLNRVAQLRAQEIVEKWSHTRPNGEEWKTAFKDAGVSASYRGENLAMGQSSPEATVNGWMSSEGHRDNILNKKFTNMGVATVVIDGVTYWVQVFANEVKTTKKSPPKSGTNDSQAADSPQAASSPQATSAPAPSPQSGTESGGKSTQSQLELKEKLSQSIDLEALKNKPAATPTVGSNPGL